MEVVHNINRIELNPGDKLYFERELGGEKVKISAPYVGSLRDKYIISELPVTHKGPLFQHADSKCTVRFIARGSVYGFTSYIASLTHTPIPLIFIALPHKIEKINLRKEGRFNVFIPVSLTFSDSSDVKEQEGTIIDLSKSGCRLITPIYCDTGDRLSIKILVKEDKRPEPVQGVVRNARPNGVDNYELGVEFSDTCEDLAEFVQKLQGYLGEGEQ